MFEHVEVDCPSCGIRINIPFIRALQAKAIEEADVEETNAREELANLREWFQNVSFTGLVMAWMLSEYDVLRDYPPVISGLIRFNFDEVIDAVTPDVKVAEKAKAFLKEALDKTGKK